MDAPVRYDTTSGPLAGAGTPTAAGISDTLGNRTIATHVAQDEEERQRLIAQGVDPSTIVMATDGSKPQAGGGGNFLGDAFNQIKGAAAAAANNVVNTANAAVHGDVNTVYQNTAGQVVKAGEAAAGDVKRAGSDVIAGNVTGALGEVGNATRDAATGALIVGAGTNPLTFTAAAGAAPVVTKTAQQDIGAAASKVSDKAGDIIKGNGSADSFGAPSSSGGSGPGGAPPAPGVAPGGTAPQITPSQVAQPGTINPTLVAAQNITAPATITAPDIASPGTIAAGHVQAPGPITAQQVATPGGVSAGSVTADRIAEQQLQNAPGDIALDSDARAIQQQSIQQLQDAAAGKTASAAEQLLRKGIDENVGTQLGMAATLQGRSPGAALRQGLIGSQNAIAKSSADMAALRAQEQEQARKDLLTAATNMRGQDIDIAKSNQNVQLQESITNLTTKIDVLKANAANALAAGQTNVASALQAQIATMNAQLDAAKANAANSLQAQIASGTLSLEASKADVTNALQAAIATGQLNLDADKARAADQLQAAIVSGQLGTQVMIANATNALAAGQSNQAAALDAAKAMLSAQTTTNVANASNQTQADIANQQAWVAQHGQDLSYLEKVADQGIAQEQLNYNKTRDDKDRQERYEAAKAMLAAGDTKAAAEILAAIAPKLV